MKKFIAMLLLVVLVTCLASCTLTYEPDVDTQTTAEVPKADEPKEDEYEEVDLEEIDAKLTSYRKALRLIDKEKFQEAYDILLTIKDYRNANEYLERFSFKYSDSIITTSSTATTYHYEYNEYGKTTLQSNSSTNSSIVESFVFEYDDNQNLLSEVHYKYGVKWDFIYYTYDKNNNVTSQTRSGYGTVNYEYDRHGNMIKAFTNEGDVTDYTYDDEGRLLSQISGCNKTVFEYDSEGNCTKIVQTYNVGEDDERSIVVTQQYDRKGNLIRKQITQSSGYTYYSEYEYDENGNRIKEATYYPRNEYVIFSWKYDNNGNKTEHHRDDEDGRNYSYFYEYDGKGNCIEETYISYPENHTNIITYEYDGYGNLIKRRETYDTASYITTYTGYKLYYNPYGTQILPPDYWVKG